MTEDSPGELTAAPGCSLWFGWLAASIAGSLLGWAGGWWLSYFVPGSVSTAVIGLFFGLCLGVFQMLVLSAHLERSWQWIAATAIGWAAGFPAGAAAAAALGLDGFRFGLLTGGVSGIAAGILQWLVLRQKHLSAGWWLPASAFAWASSLLYYQPGISWLGAYYGLLSGMVSGLALFWLVYRPAPE